MYRHSVNKSRSAHSFRKHTSRTRAVNVAPPPQRGGFRL